MNYFGDESMHIQNMAKKTNRPFDWNMDAQEMRETPPEREGRRKIYHPSELGPNLDPDILSIIEGDTAVKEPNRVFKRTAMGVATGALVMYILNANTDLGYNPINYVLPFSLFLNR